MIEGLANEAMQGRSAEAGVILSNLLGAIAGGSGGRGRWRVRNRFNFGEDRGQSPPPPSATPCGYDREPPEQERLGA